MGQFVADHPDQQTEPGAYEAVEVEAIGHDEVMANEALEGFTTRTLE
jgi:hypothetical protein